MSRNGNDCRIRRALSGPLAWPGFAALPAPPKPDYIMVGPLLDRRPRAVLPGRGGMDCGGATQPRMRARTGGHIRRLPAMVGKPWKIKGG